MNLKQLNMNQEGLMAKKAKKSKVYAGVKHPFNYELMFEGSGKRIVKKAMAKVRPARKPVTIQITGKEPCLSNHQPRHCSYCAKPFWR